MLSGPQVAGYAEGAGFTGDALLRMVAIAKRESGWDENAVGDVAIQTATWGPSVGLTQIRTLKAETGSGSDRDISALLPGGRGDPARQMGASFRISAGGTNFAPWSTAAGLPQADLAAAQAAIGGAVTPPAGGPATGGGTPAVATAFNPLDPLGVLGGGGFSIAGAIDDALKAFLGIDVSVNEWLASLVVRGLELVGGALVLAVGLVMFLDVLGARGVTRPARRGVVGRTMGHARKWVIGAAL